MISESMLYLYLIKCVETYNQTNTMKRIFIVAVAILALTSCDKIDVETIKRIVIRGNASYEEVFNKVATPLSEGQTKLHIVLPEEPSDEMFKAIRRALIETEEVADGSIDMTLWGVKVIGEDAFAYHADLNNEYVNELKSVTLPDAVEIKRYAFYGCRELRTFSAPEVKTIGINVFVICNNLIDIDLPKVEKIGNGTFHNIKNLKSICLPELKELSSSIFSNCDNLETVILPKVTRIREMAFENVTSLKTIVFGAPIESVEGDIFSIHGELQANHTEHIDLVLSKEQRRMVNDSYDEQNPRAGFWHASGGAFDFSSNEFLGYRFKSIKAY